MNTMKLNEQIAFLRKAKGITQEELAKALGVTNQSVSKWESGQCCPDIQLLPELAGYFAVSVDELLGYKSADVSNNLALQMKTSLENLPNGEDYRFALKHAYILHAALISKYMEQNHDGNPGWDTDAAVEHAGKGEWGLSCISDPQITSYMRRESVFFSSNQNMNLSNADMRKICNLFHTFSDMKNIKVIMAIYHLTIVAEDLYVSIPDIAGECGLTEDAVSNVIENEICEYLHVNIDTETPVYRIEGCCLYMVPLMTMFSDIGCNIG